MDDFELDAFESYAKIVVIGVGGAGSNAVNQMLEEKIANIEFWVFNTDAQALATSKAENRLVLGRQTTRGLGAGGDPQVGREAALDSVDDIKRVIEGANMVFIAAGMGGGTGTGAAPVVAKLAKDAGALTVAIVTRPFTFEGNSRKVKAVEGITELKSAVDSIIIVSNDKLMFMNGSRPISEAFNESDKVLAQSVKTITDLILLPGLINLDFADVQTVMKDKGVAHIGIGTANGDDKAIEAVKIAVASPLLETTIEGASHVIINISGDIGLMEANEAASYVQELAGDNANIIFGAMYDDSVQDQATITVIATGLDGYSAGAASAMAGFNFKPQTTARPISAPTYESPYAKTSSQPAREIPGLNKPKPVESNVEEKGIKIPEFLQKRR